MSILLVDPPEALGAITVERLLSQGDEVRVVTPRPEPWRSLGAHVAVGEPDDADLIERAGQGTRTIVLFRPGTELMAAATEASRAARIERIVVVGDRASATPEDERVLLLRVPKGWVGRRISDEDLAAAIDRADDWAGATPLDVELGGDLPWDD